MVFFFLFQSQVEGASNGLIRGPLSHITKETDPIRKGRKRMDNIKKHRVLLTDALTSQIVDKRTLNSAALADSQQSLQNNVADNSQVSGTNKEIEIENQALIERTRQRHDAQVG